MGTFAALDQRIATRYAIKPMDLAESAAYLRHHMALAGREEPVRRATPSPGCTASPPACPRPEQRRHRRAHRRRGRRAGTSSTMPAPGKQSPSSPATDRRPAAAPSPAPRHCAGGGGYQAGHQAAEHEQQAAAGRTSSPASRRPRSTSCCSKPSTHSPASSPATTAAKTDHHPRARHHRQALPERARQTLPNHVQTTWPLTPPTANDRHQQQPANMKLARALNPRATHGNTLVMLANSQDHRTISVQLAPATSGLSRTPRTCRSSCVDTGAEQIPKLTVPLLYYLRRDLGLKDGPGSARAASVSLARVWGSSSRHRPGQA